MPSPLDSRRQRRRLTVLPALLLTTAVAVLPDGAAVAKTFPLQVGVEGKEGARRFVFHWRREVGFATEQDGDEWRIRFDRAVEINAKHLERLAPELHPRLVPSDAQANGGSGGVALAFTVPPGSDGLRVSRRGVEVVVESGPDAAAASLAPQPPTPSKDKPERATAHDLAKPPVAAPTKLGAAQPIVLQTRLPVRYAVVDGNASLRFDWGKPVAAAIFPRGNALWVVFDTALPVDLDELRRKGRAAVPVAEQIPNASATVLRLAVLDGFMPSVRRSDNAWVVDLKPEELRAEQPVAVEAQPASQPPRIVFALRDGAPLVTVADPEIGDTLLVVPTAEVGRGVAGTIDYADFTALPTAQGIALRPNADGLTVAVQRDAVGVTSSSGLSLSPERDRMARQAAPAAAGNAAAAAAALPRLFDFAAWQAAGGEGSEIDRRQRLQGAVAAAPALLRSGARLDLARFYVAQGYGPEARGVLDAIERDDVSFAADPSFRALRGAAAVLSGERAAAHRELDRRSLDGEPEAGLWRGALAASEQSWPAAAREFAKGLPLLGAYPKPLRHPFAIEAADALLSTGGPPADAQSLLDGVLNDDPIASHRAAALFLKARILAAAGDKAGAMTLWDELAKGSDPLMRARAALARTDLALETGKISRADAIKTLEQLRFAWRGDEYEFAVLRRLGELKIADDDFRNGIEGLRQAIAAFPNHPERPAVAQEIADGFAAAFTGPQADSVPPVKALALFDEYNRDLLPAGDKGNEIIRRLADRLVRVDLLDRAAALLQGQVASRLDGVEKARGATRLALVRLLDHKPDAALEALAIDVGPAAALPPELATQRRQLQARALIDAGRPAEAVALIAEDKSRDADRLRADVAWKAQDWTGAAAMFARVVPPPPPAGGKLDDGNARIVLDWATALTLAKDALQLAKLRDDYGRAMEAGPYRDAFRVVAADATAGDPRTDAAKVAQVGDLQSFMNDYRQRFASPKPSATN
ncbi:MAG TPA: tetratricopeptide repeat protein [Stellaceae bacterium]